jgi:peptide alpha-N-acetyltransferase
LLSLHLQCLCIPQEDIPTSEAYEHSELLFYKAQVMREGGQPAAALALLSEQRDRLKDPLGVLTAEASLNLQLGNTEQAAQQYRKLLSLNPDNYDMHIGLQASMGVAAALAVAEKSWQQPANSGNNNNNSSSGGQQQQQQQRPHGEFWHGGKGRRRLLQSYSAEERGVLQGVYDELIAEHPKSAACQRIPLDFLVGPEFEAAAEKYMQRYITKGIPSLFADLKALYTDADKAAALGRLAEDLREKLIQGGAAGSSSSSNCPSEGLNGGVNSSSGSSGSDGESNPLTWVYHYLAQHHDKTGQTAAALAAADAALALAPEVVELYSSKAKILRHAGDLKAAAYYADQGRLRDLSDR